MITVKFQDIHGKDYLTQDEAAHYMCVSMSKFFEIKKAADLRPIDCFGKLLFRKKDLIDVIENHADYDL